jgi:hypothetical protein
MRCSYAALALVLGAGTACRPPEVAIPPPHAAPVRVQHGSWVLALTMMVPTSISGQATPMEVTQVAVMRDGRVRQLPDSPVEDKHWMNSPPESAFYLRGPSAYPLPAGDHIEDGTGKVLVACREGRILVFAMESGRLELDGFGDGRVRVAIDARGDAILTRASETIAFRYEGLSPGDVCTAALLFNMIAAPRAAG